MSYDSLIAAVLEKKGLMEQYLDSSSLLKEDGIPSTTIKLGDVKRMRILLDDSTVPKKLQGKNKMNGLSEDKGKRTVEGSTTESLKLKDESVPSYKEVGMIHWEDDVYITYTSLINIF